MGNLQTFTVADWQVDAPRLVLRDGDGDETRISPRAMQVLVVLAAARGEVVPKQDLMDQVWGMAEVSEGMLSQTVLELRTALGDDARNPRFIETIRRVGFRLIPEIDEGAIRQPRRSARLPIGIVAAIAVIALASGIWLSRADDGPARLLVVPFDDRSAPEFDFFARAMTEQIALRLSATPRLTLISERAFDRLDRESVPPGEIADRLDVDLVLSGSVVRNSDTISLVARLTDARQDEVLWITSSERPAAEIFTLQEETVRAVADIVLSGVDLPTFTAPTQNLQAYDAYLRGRKARGVLNPASHAASIDHFEDALRIDPRFHLARANLAIAFAERGFIYRQGDELLPAALREAELALIADPQLADAHYAKALAFVGMGKYAEAHRSILRAADIAPGATDVAFLAGNLAETRGELAAAVRWYEQAFVTDPLLPRTVAAGRVYFLLGDAERAELHATRGHALSPGYPSLYLAHLRSLQGRHGEALELCRALMPQRLPRSRNLCGFSALLAGQEEVARKWLASSWQEDPRAQTGPFSFAASATHLAYLSEGDAKQRYLEASEQVALAAIEDGNDHWALRYNLAAVAAMRGDVATADDWLREAFEQGFRDPYLPARDPALQNVLESDRYRDLQRDIEAALATERETLADS